MNLDANLQKKLYLCTINRQQNENISIICTINADFNGTEPLG